MSGFNIDLPCFDNFLQDLCILSREFLHFALLFEVILSFLVGFGLFRFMAIGAFINRLSNVFLCDFLQSLPMVVQ